MFFRTKTCNYLFIFTGFDLDPRTYPKRNIALTTGIPSGIEELSLIF